MDENFETYSLIWLNSSSSDTHEHVLTQKKLRTSINHLVTFEDDQKCFEYIQSASNDDRIVFIVNGKLGRIIVPKIIQFRQIISIYVYCLNKTDHQEWARHFTKIKGVFTELNQMIKRIESILNDRQHESLSINIFNSNPSDEGQSTSDLNGQFLHSQILIDCLIRMKINQNDQNEFISFCQQLYKDNKSELKIIKEFEKDYLSERALWWYTRQSFLYRLLNKALRVQNIDLLYLFRFFIRDIQQQLEKNKCQSPVRVYRAQLMSKEEVEMLKGSLGEFISMNSFLSTSLDHQLALFYLAGANTSNNSEGVIFEIDADPQIENIKSFSNITSFSFFPVEQEILFMAGSIFRLNKIFQDNQGIWNIQMSLCSFNDQQLQVLFQHMKIKLGIGETSLFKFSQVLRDMGKFEHAKKYFLRSLSQLPKDHQDIASCYFQLGCVARGQSDYDSSLEWCMKSLEIEKRILGPDHPDIASNYNNMGNVYETKGDYARALESYNEALTICERVYGENHTDVALCLNNMGNVYQKMKKHSKALELYEKSLAIREKYLPANHFYLGGSHNNIGNLQRRLGKQNLALKHFNQSLEIYSKSLPSQHPRIASTLKNIGLVYEDKNDIKRALSYYQEAAIIYCHLFASTHPDVVEIEQYIQRLSILLK